MILVVDDNLNNQFVARAALERLGYRTHLVDNGQDAIVAVLRNTYQLILMDCRMEPIDGYQATLLIREAEAELGRRTPIVALTACALDGDKERCIEAGMDAYYAKPVTLEIFKDIVERWAAR